MLEEVRMRKYRIIEQQTRRRGVVEDAVSTTRRDMMMRGVVMIVCRVMIRMNGEGVVGAGVRRHARGG